MPTARATRTGPMRTRVRCGGGFLAGAAGSEGGRPDVERRRLTGALFRVGSSPDREKETSLRLGHHAR